MVAAVESEAVERALARVLQGPVVEEAVHGALESEAVKKALIEALDSEMVDEVWRRLLASDEAQKLVERIAEAPELRAAISAQSVGLIGDIGRTIGRAARRLDDTLERVVRRVFFRQRRAEPTDRAGAVSRALALGVDGAHRQPRLLRAGGHRGADRLGLLRQRQRRLRPGAGAGHGRLAGAGLLLPGRLLVPGGADSRHALLRHQARRRRPGALARRRGEPPDRARAVGDHPWASASSASSSASGAAAGTTSSPTSTSSTSANRPEPAPWSTLAPAGHEPEATPAPVAAGD